jgi:hypothetical protein
MKTYSIYIDKEDVNRVEEEERSGFVKSILLSFGVPLDGIWDDDYLTVENKIKLRDLLEKLELRVIYEGGEARIYHQKDLVAEWFRPRFIMREDPSAIDKTKRYYYEMVISTNSMFEGEDNG